MRAKLARAGAPADRRLRARRSVLESKLAAMLSIADNRGGACGATSPIDQNLNFARIATYPIVKDI
jgi:hypothetical protein